MRKGTKSGSLLRGRRRPLGQWQPRPEEVERLHECEDQYRTLLQLAPDAVLVHQEGRIVYVNVAGLRVFGARGLAEMSGPVGI